MAPNARAAADTDDFRRRGIASDDRPPEGAARVAGVPGHAGAPRVTLDNTSDSTTAAAPTGGEQAAGEATAARPGYPGLTVMIFSAGISAR